MAEQGAENSGLKEGRMTLIGHLTELRNRLGIAIAAFLVLFLLSVAPLPGTTSNSISYQVFVFLQAPLAVSGVNALPDAASHRLTCDFNAPRPHFQS